jgi:hypothetical protein
MQIVDDALSAINTTLGTKGDYKSVYEEIQSLHTKYLDQNNYFAEMTKETVVEEIQASIADYNTNTVSPEFTKVYGYFSGMAEGNTVVKEIDARIDSYNTNTINPKFTAVDNYFADMTKGTIVEEIETRIAAGIAAHNEIVSNTYVKAQDYIAFQNNCALKSELEAYTLTSDLESKYAQKSEFEAYAEKTDLEGYILNTDFASKLDARMSELALAGQSQLTTMEALLNKVVELEAKVKALEENATSQTE